MKNSAFVQLSNLRHANRPSVVSSLSSRRFVLDDTHSSTHATGPRTHSFTGRTSVSLGQGLHAAAMLSLRMSSKRLASIRFASERVAANLISEVQISRRSVMVLPAALACPAAPACASVQAPSLPETEVGSIFVGRYTDPNHPGGYREIKLLGDGKAEVTGGGGSFEPKFFTLPATVSREVSKNGATADYITINFLPKGGPPNFKGAWDKDGITFLFDRNHWPKQQ